MLSSLFLLLIDLKIASQKKRRQSMAAMGELKAHVRHCLLYGNFNLDPVLSSNLCLKLLYKLELFAGILKFPKLEGSLI